MMKRLAVMVLALLAVFGTALPVSAKAAVIKKTEYEGRGIVEVDFTTDVQYRDVKVTVKDAAGQKLDVTIKEMDDDDLTFKVKGLKADSEYTYKISGIRAGQSGKYGSVSGSFRTPKTELYIKKVQYDAKDKELELEFFTRVEFKKGLTVTLQDAAGTKYGCKVLEIGKDELELKVKGLKKGVRYTVKVAKVRVKGTSKYKTVTKTFTLK